jgi:hypothetical protein
MSHLKGTQQDTIINVKYLLLLSYFNETWILHDRLLQNLQISYFTKIHPVWAEFHADRLNRANSNVLQFMNMPKNEQLCTWIDYHLMCKVFENILWCIHYT